MTDLIMPVDGSRMMPGALQQIGVEKQAGNDSVKGSWGVDQHLMRLIRYHPGLASTVVDYTDALLCDNTEYVQIPRPGGATATDQVLFPSGGFIDRTTKSLVISLVSLLSRSRYAIIHHTITSYNNLSQCVDGQTTEDKAKRAEFMLLHLVNGQGKVDFERKSFFGKPLYSELQLMVLRLAYTLHRDAHAVTDQQIDQLKHVFRIQAEQHIQQSQLMDQFSGGEIDVAYLDAYVNAMLVEVSWCILHFSGLFNRWLVVMKVCDDDTAIGNQDNDIISHYNQCLPQSIKQRNNALLGVDGWGSSGKSPSASRASHAFNL